MKNRGSIALATALTAALYVFVTATVFAPLYNWMYIKERGWDSWIRLGECAATAKAVVWPYYVISGRPVIPPAPPSWTVQDYESLRHFAASQNKADEAVALAARTGNLARISHTQALPIADLFILSLREAQAVQKDFLEKMFPGLSGRYQTEYMNGMQMIIVGLKTENSTEVMAGSYSFNTYLQWIKANAKKLRFPK